MAEHQFNATDPGGSCSVCGIARGSDQAVLPCNPPKVTSIPRARPRSVVDDFDALNARVEELRKEG